MSFEGENERDGEVEDGMAEEEWECVRSRWECGWGKVASTLLGSDQAGWDGMVLCPVGMGQRVTEQVSGSPDSGYGGCGRVDVRKGKGKTDLT